MMRRTIPRDGRPMPTAMKRTMRDMQDEERDLLQQQRLDELRSRAQFRDEFKRETDERFRKMYPLHPGGNSDDWIRRIRPASPPPPPPEPIDEGDNRTNIPMYRIARDLHSARRPKTGIPIPKLEEDEGRELQRLGIDEAENALAIRRFNSIIKPGFNSSPYGVADAIDVYNRNFKKDPYRTKGKMSTKNLDQMHLDDMMSDIDKIAEWRDYRVKNRDDERSFIEYMDQKRRERNDEYLNLPGSINMWGRINPLPGEGLAYVGPPERDTLREMVDRNVVDMQDTFSKVRQKVYEDKLKNEGQKALPEIYDPPKVSSIVPPSGVKRSDQFVPKDKGKTIFSSKK